MLDNFACCHAAALLFFLLIENVGGYDSLLIHCGVGVKTNLEEVYILNFFWDPFLWVCANDVYKDSSRQGKRGNRLAGHNIVSNGFSLIH